MVWAMRKPSMEGELSRMATMLGATTNFPNFIS